MGKRKCINNKKQFIMKNNFKLFKHASVSNFNQFVELFNQKRNVVYSLPTQTKEMDVFINCPDVTCKRVSYGNLTDFNFTFYTYDTRVINDAYSQIIKKHENSQLPLFSNIPFKDQIEIVNPKTLEIIKFDVQIWRMVGRNYAVEIY